MGFRESTGQTKICAAKTKIGIFFRYAANGDRTGAHSKTNVKLPAREKFRSLDTTLSFFSAHAEGEAELVKQNRQLSSEWKCRSGRSASCRAEPLPYLAEWHNLLRSDGQMFYELHGHNCAGHQNRNNLNRFGGQFGYPAHWIWVFI
jgi:hypothetical protein